jgi:hypothetical protein
MSGGGLGSVLGTAGSIAAGGSPLGAFGSTLGSQVAGNMFGGGGGGGGSGPGAPGGNIGGVGRQNQTQITGPYAGMNPASPAYNFMRQQEMQRAQQQQMQPQVQQPAITPSQVQPTLTAQDLQMPFNQWVQSQNQNPNVPALTTQELQQKYMNEVIGRPQTLTPQLQQIQQGMDRLRQQPMGGGVFSQGQPFQGPSFGFARPYMQDLMKQQQMRDMSPRPMPQGLAGLMGQLQGGPQTFRGFM